MIKISTMLLTGYLVISILLMCLATVGSTSGSFLFSPDWRFSATCNDDTDIKQLNKEELKLYIQAKDRLFFAFLDLYIGDERYSRSGGAKVEYDLLGKDVRQSRKHSVIFDAQNSQIKSTYIRSGKFGNAETNFRKLKKIEPKLDPKFKSIENVAVLGDFNVALEENNSGGSLTFELKTHTDAVPILRIIRYRSRRWSKESGLYRDSDDNDRNSFRRGKQRQFILGKNKKKLISITKPADDDKSMRLFGNRRIRYRMKMKKARMGRIDK